MTPLNMARMLADAKNRAWRTFVQGLALDVATTLVMLLATTLPGVQWTRTWWLALGGLLAKTAVQTAVAYLARKLVPPAVST